MIAEERFRNGSDFSVSKLMRARFDASQNTPYVHAAVRTASRAFLSFRWSPVSV